MADGLSCIRALRRQMLFPDSDVVFDEALTSVRAPRARVSFAARHCSGPMDCTGARHLRARQRLNARCGTNSLYPKEEL